MHFEKVSLNRWAKDIDIKGVDGKTLMKWHNEIKLPQQSSKCSMGMDFFMPYGVHILPHNKCKIATGIRWVCDTEEEKAQYGMVVAPRSSIGAKLGLRLTSTLGYIDADYSEADNEGDIYLIFENTTDKQVVLPQGKAVAQGIIQKYYVPNGAESDAQRTGGIGSTDNTEGHV